jgi:CubicO group peptidase (beta-lactamase class C family)
MSGLPWAGEHGLDVAGLPSATVAHDPSRTEPLGRLPEVQVDGLPIVPGDDLSPTVRDVLAQTATDAWVVLRSGAVVLEAYAPGVGPASLHPVMSISKSLVGLLAGILIDRGALAVDRPVTDYVPALLGSGYAGATVQHVLDMRSGVHFREDYADPTSHIRAMDAAIAGAPGAPAGLRAFLLGLIADRPHGGLFEYRSCESDVLGWVCEAASGLPMPELAAQLIWRPMGAESDAAFLTDTVGGAVHDGGLLATARDVARLGQLVLAGGMVGGREVVPVSWIAGLWQVSPELRAAFAASSGGPFMPGGWYHNQWWVLPGPHGDLLLGLGIHGQLLRIDPATRTVIVKLSSWSTAQNPLRLHDTLRACDAVAAAVSGRAGGSGPRFGPGRGRIPPVAGR